MVGGGGEKGRWGFKGEREEREMTGRCLRERGCRETLMMSREIKSDREKGWQGD